MSDLDKFNYECEGQMSLFDDENPMDRITTEMAEHICDNLCRFPREMDQEELDEHCCECKLGQFICDILNEYNKLNDFEQTQCCKLLQKIAELESKLPKFNIGDTAYLVDFESGEIDTSEINGIVTRTEGSAIEFEYDSDYLVFYNDDIGKIVFENREDAQEALARHKESEVRHD